MKVKTVVMFFLFFGPLILMVTSVVTSTVMILLMWMIIGFGMVGIGTCVMHDSVHGSYSKYNKVNKILGYTMNMVGGNAFIWKIQHNILHHTYTNIHQADEDISMPGPLRFSPHEEIKWFHRYQYLYVWFFYGLSTIFWITSKDFVQLIKFHKMGLLGKRNKFSVQLRQIIIWKILYFGYMLVLPLILIPASPWIILSGFLLMHFITGLLLSMIFQTAHIMTDCSFPLPGESGSIENNWAIHQMETTTNYAPKSRIFSWFIGGLNYQVEHHLFSNICHVHYRALSRIVSKTAKEYNVPYYSKRSFLAAVVNHVSMLRQLGRLE
jgi:linoleoyl-CoA desaturase